MERSAALLRLCGKLMRLPARAICKASTYFQHYLVMTSVSEQQNNPGLDPVKGAHPDQQMIVAACLLLASKVEEAALSNNHLLNVVCMLHQLVEQHSVPLSRVLSLTQQGARGHSAAKEAGTAAAPHAAPAAANLAGPTTVCDGVASKAPIPEAAPSSSCSPQHQLHQPPPPSDPSPATLPHVLAALLPRCHMLVGDAYYTAKEQLLLAEQVVLRLLRFRLPTPHPASALLHIAAVLCVPRAVAAASLCVLHDAATFSPVLLPLPSSASGGGQHARVRGCAGAEQGTRAEESAGGLDWEGWGPCVEADWARGRALMQAAVHEAQHCGLHGAGGTQHVHTVPAAVHGSTPAAAVVGGADGAHEGAVSQGAGLLARGVLVLPEGSEHVHMELHETLVAAACLHAAMLIVQPSHQHQQQQHQQRQQQHGEADECLPEHACKRARPNSIRPLAANASRPLSPPAPFSGDHETHMQASSEKQLDSSAPAQPIVLHPPAHAQQQLQQQQQQQQGWVHAGASHHASAHAGVHACGEGQGVVSHTHSQHSAAVSAAGVQYEQSAQAGCSQGEWQGGVNRADGAAASPADCYTQGVDCQPLPLPTWAAAFGVSPEAVEAVAAVALGAISRACEGLGKGDGGVREGEAEVLTQQA